MFGAATIHIPQSFKMNSRKLFLPSLALLLMAACFFACNGDPSDEYNLFVQNMLPDTVTIRKIVPSGRSLTFKEMAPGDTCQIAHYAVPVGQPLEQISLDAKLIISIKGDSSYTTTKADTLGPCWVKNYKLVGRRIYHFLLTDEYIQTLQ